MICQPCAAEADYRVKHDVTRCPACKREVPTYTKLSPKIVWHKVSPPEGGPRVRCPGSGKFPLVVGHAACTGCDCQHHPAKEK